MISPARVVLLGRGEHRRSGVRRNDKDRRNDFSLFSSDGDGNTGDARMVTQGFCSCADYMPDPVSTFPVLLEHEQPIAWKPRICMRLCHLNL